jgi:fatty acid desaturase
MSAMHWLNKHVTVHHPTPNVIGLDDDVDLLPWFALTEEQFQAGGPLRRFWHRHQWIAAGPAIAFNGFNLLFTSWGFLFRALRDRDRRTRMHWIDLGVICAHLALWIALPMLLFPPLAVLGFYGLRTGLMGYAMFAAFAPAHFPVEARFLPADGHTDRYAYRRRSDYMLLQTATTVNFRTGWYGRMLCSGVDHQIEHHLFPGISHVHYPKVSRVVQRFCHERGYPYRTLGWGEAIWKSLLAFKHPKRVEPALEALRERVNRGADEPALAGAALA